MEQLPYTDQELLTCIKCRDKKAFDVVYKKYWLRLHHVASRILEDEAITQDVIQDVFVSLWEKGCYKEIENLEAYLYQSVKYLCFMQLRSGAMNQKHLQRITSIMATNVIEEQFDLMELEVALKKGIETLPEKCKEVFYLSRFESLSNKKIAEQLNISPKTVENQITKAIRLLRLSVDKLVMVTCFLLP
jgi:RNA polymerase sigma-70 factor (family 1)